MADIIGSWIKKQVKPSHSESSECALELSELTPHLRLSGQSFQVTLIKIPIFSVCSNLSPFPITLGLPVSIFKSTQKSRFLKVLLNHLIISDFSQLFFPIITLNPALPAFPTLFHLMDRKWSSGEVVKQDKDIRGYTQNGNEESL